MKSWTNNGQTYYLWSTENPTYSYNDLLEMSKGATDRYTKQAVDRMLAQTKKYMDKAGVGADEAIFDERAASKLKNIQIEQLRLNSGDEGSSPQRAQDWAATLFAPIMTQQEWDKANKGTLADKIAQAAIIAGGIALTAGGLGGYIGGVDAAGNAVAGSLWSPAGATPLAGTGGAVATTSPVTLGSLEGATFSSLAPLSEAIGGGTAVAGATGGASILGGLKGAAKLGSLLAPAADAITGIINYNNNKDAINSATDAQKAYLDKMLGLVDEQRRGNEERYQQARQDVLDYYNQARNDGMPFMQKGMEGLDALGNYYGNSANVWGALGNLAGVNGREGQQAAINMIESSPAFEAMVKQGENAILQNASATGGLRGGNTQYALAQFRPQILSGLMDKQYSQLSGMAGQGMQAANSAAGYGTNIANNLINNAIHTGATLGDMGIRAGNNDAGFLTNMMNIYGQMAKAEQDAIIAKANNKSERNSGIGGLAGGIIGAFL